MTRRLRHFGARLGLAALFALQAALVAHAFALPTDAAAQAVTEGPAGDCARMAAAPTNDGNLKANLCQVHCQAVVQMDANADFAFAVPVPPPALHVVVAYVALPASAWLEPLAAKIASPPSQLLYARFLI